MNKNWKEMYFYDIKKILIKNAKLRVQNDESLNYETYKSVDFIASEIVKYIENET